MRTFIAGALSATALFLLLGSAPKNAEQPELSTLMLRFQIHADKLWFAGQAGNWTLADFYGHELDETLGEIVAANIVDEGVAVSKLADPMLGPSLKAMRAAVTKKDPKGFAAGYHQLVGACNACHAASKHAFIKVQTPTRPAYTNQVYAP